MLQVDLTNSIKELKKLKAKRVYVQVPEGLKVRAEDIIEQLEKGGIEAVTGMDACFGACDLKQDEAKRNKCNAILHIGHSAFVEKTQIPVVYAPLKQDIEGFEEFKQKMLNYLTNHKIKQLGLTTTVQFLHYLPELKKFFAKQKIIAEIGKGKRSNDGQVLGCNYSSALVKAKTILYLGDGLFHPLGIHFATGKNVILANPHDLEIRELEEEKNKFLRQRILLIEQAKNATNFAILVSTKEGQNRISIAQSIQKQLEKKGKKAKIYAMDFISQNALLGINAEAYINTACPRISIDDFLQFKKPIINYPELEYLLGKKDYEKYELLAVY